MNKTKLVELIKLAQGERTQNEYALHCGIDSATLTKIIKGTRIPKPLTLKKLANKAHNGVTYESLMAAAGHIDFQKDQDDTLINGPKITEKIITPTIFAKRLTELRRIKKWTQDDMAKQIKIASSSYSRYETGEREPDFETVKKIAAIFNVTTDYLLGNSNNHEPPEVVIPEVLKDVKVAFHRGEFEDLNQYEIDRLAEFATFLKSTRK